MWQSGLFNEFMEIYMAFFDAVIAFKGALLGALLGNNVPRNDFENGYRSWSQTNVTHHHHRPHTVRPHAGNTYPYQTNTGKPHTQQPTICVQPSPYRPTYPTYPTFTLNR